MYEVKEDIGYTQDIWFQQKGIGISRKYIALMEKQIQETTKDIIMRVQEKYAKDSD